LVQGCSSAKIVTAAFHGELEDHPRFWLVWRSDGNFLLARRIVLRRCARTKRDQNRFSAATSPSNCQNCKTGQKQTANCQNCKLPNWQKLQNLQTRNVCCWGGISWPSGLVAEFGATCGRRAGRASEKPAYNGKSKRNQKTGGVEPASNLIATKRKAGSVRSEKRGRRPRWM